MARVDAWGHEMKIASVKPFCGNCARRVEGDGCWGNDYCIIPEPHDSYVQTFPSRRVECEEYNHANDCKYWTRKRLLIEKVVEFFWRKT